MLEKYVTVASSGHRWPYVDVNTWNLVHERMGGYGSESIRHFADCLVGGRVPLVTLEDGLRATEVITAAEASAQSGQAVTVDRLAFN
jgi:predicted dehydrogenase